MKDLTHAYGNGANIVAIYVELRKLENKYNHFINQKELANEVEMLKYSIAESMNGSPEAADYILKHGKDIISDIKINLEAAAGRGQVNNIEESSADSVRYFNKANDIINNVKNSGEW